MTKTPEQMAEEYVDQNSGGECSDDTGGLRAAFLAGYQASEKDIHLHWNELWKNLHKRIEESSLPAMDAMEGRYLRQVKELEAKIAELETELDNWRHCAIHGDDGL
jgi:hypothetical protein